MRRNSFDSSRLAAAIGMAGLMLAAAPASAAAWFACPDGTQVQDSKDCARHGAVGSAVATTPPPQPQNTSIFDRWGNLLNTRSGGGGPAKPAPKPSGGLAIPGADLKTTPTASDPMPMP
jgi:hypothetical protein